MQFRFDPSVRVAGNRTVVSFDDLLAGDGAVPVGESEGIEVEVVEPESGLHGSAFVEKVDATSRTLTLAVDWPSLGVDT